MFMGSWVKVGNQAFPLSTPNNFVVYSYINSWYSFSQLQHVEQVGHFETKLSRLD